MKSLTLSLIIPVYNEERHLKACLDAIAAQTERPDEVIVVDNNSSDRSVEIAKSYAFVRVAHEPKQGVVFARDRGFDEAKSTIIGRIDADSIVSPGWVHYVKRFYGTEQHTDHALTGAGYFYNMRLPKINGWIQSQLAYRTNRFVLGHYITWGSNMAILREHWLKARPYVCHRDDIHEDLDLAIHLHRLGYKISYRSGLIVGVYLSRVYDKKDDRRQYMARWPTTLKVHGNKLWWMGVVGNIILILLIQIFILIELLCKLFDSSTNLESPSNSDTHR